MNQEVPKLGTFGALMRFAAQLEKEAAQRYADWGREPDLGGRFGALADSHRKRADQLARMVQEQLNEMTLEPIGGLDASDYLPPEGPPSGADAAARTAWAREVEARLARLYEDATQRAGHVLGGAARSLQRLARQSRRAIEELQS